MLQPMRTKFRKARKGRIHGAATSAVDLAFGQYGLKAIEPERVTARQIEAARRALTRHMKRSGRGWDRIVSDVAGANKTPGGRDGGGAACAHAPHEALGAGLDSDVSGRAGVEKAAGSAYGFGEGHPRTVGRS